MKTLLIQTPKSSHTLPDTKNFETNDFSKMMFKITDNRHDDELANSYGDYAIKIDFSYDEYEVTRKSKGIIFVSTGGLDKKLLSISNLLPKGTGLTNMKKALNANSDKSPEIMDDIWPFFKEELNKLYCKKSRKPPMFYTSSIKHVHSRRNLDSCAVMIVPTDDKIKVFAFMGNIKFSFEVEKDHKLSEKDKAAGFHSLFAVNHTNRTINWYEEQNEFDLNEFDISEQKAVKPKISSPNLIKTHPLRTTVSNRLKIKYGTELDNVDYQYTDDALERLLAEVEN
jgi:hypothetical protein